MSKSTSNARAEVSTTGDVIWKDTVRQELRAAREWEKQFDYLMPEERRSFMRRMQQEVEKKCVWIDIYIYKCIFHKNNGEHTQYTKELALERASRADDERKYFKGRKAPPLEIVDPKPFMEELSLIPDPPQRTSSDVAERFQFNQSPSRDIASTDNIILRKRSLHNYYNEVPNPPHRKEEHNVSEWRRGDPDVNSTIRRLRDTHTKKLRDLKEEEQEAPKTDLKHGNEMSEMRHDVRDEDLEQSIWISSYKRRQPPSKIKSLEIFGVAQHGLKRAVFDWKAFHFTWTVSPAWIHIVITFSHHWIVEDCDRSNHGAVIAILLRSCHNLGHNSVLQSTCVDLIDVDTSHDAAISTCRLLNHRLWSQSS